MTSHDERRHQMLDRIRTQLNDGTPISGRKAAVAQRLGEQAPHLVPARAKQDAAGLRAMFETYLKGQTAAVVAVETMDRVPGAIAHYLRSQNLPLRVRMGADGELSALPWSTEPALTIDRGAAVGSDEVGLSRAVAGVAETGTLVMASGAANPVTLNYVPETHVVVLKGSEIRGNYEAAFDDVRARFGRGVMPRTLKSHLRSLAHSRHRRPPGGRCTRPPPPLRRHRWLTGEPRGPDIAGGRPQIQASNQRRLLYC